MYILDHLFQSTRVSDENSSVTKTFHFSKLISTQDFFLHPTCNIQSHILKFQPFLTSFAIFMHLMIYFELNDPIIGKGGKQIPLVPVDGTNRYQYPLVPVGATNRDDPCATAERCVGSLVPPR